MIINTRPEKQARRLGYKIEQAELNYSNIPITDITQRNFLSKDEISNLKKNLNIKFIFIFFFI